MKIVIANSIGKDKQGDYIIHSPSRWSEAVQSKFHWFAYYPWEFQPLQKASERYMRNHMDLNVLEEQKRFPRGE